MDFTKDEIRSLANFHQHHSTKASSKTAIIISIITYINQYMGGNEEGEGEVTGCQTPQYIISLTSKTHYLFFVQVLSLDYHHEESTCQ